MPTKVQFYKAFAALHRSRLELFFEKVITKNKFITSLLFVSAEDLPDSDLITNANLACARLNEYFECDFYSSELISVEYSDGDFIFTFAINIGNNTSDEFVMEFDLIIYPNDYEINDENIEFAGNKKEFWINIQGKLNTESFFGKMTRS
jgi:hypothetical protein